MNIALRNTIKTIDSYLFAGKLRKLNRQRWKYHSYWSRKPLISYILQKKYIDNMQDTFKYNNNICFTRKKQNFLGDFFYKYATDKGYFVRGINECLAKGHSYHDIYNLLFFQHKHQTKLLLECGVGTKNIAFSSNMSNLKDYISGGSLRAWRDYFPYAQIIGIDIDPDVMFTENRISTFECDQTSKISIDKFITQANLQPNTVDIIIDDGLHEFNANITFFKNTKHLLKDNGIYVIEDFFIKNKEQHLFIDYFSNLDSYDVTFIKMSISYLIVITKNN